MKWFISDTHFNHANILQYEPHRPLNYEDIIFRNIYRLVTPSDTIVHLGDFTFGKGEDRLRVAQRWKDINCKQKILVLGNHDRHPEGYYKYACGFDEIFPLSFVEDGILFSHYPRLSTDGHRPDDRYTEQMLKLTESYTRFNCVFQVHGHTHSWCHPDTSTYFNVSVENINMCPVSLDVIQAKARKQVKTEETK